MTNQILAKRYAKALLTLGREDGNHEKYGEELDQFVTFWEETPEFADAASIHFTPKKTVKLSAARWLRKWECLRYSRAW